MKYAIRGGVIALAAVTLAACSSGSDTAPSAASDAAAAVSSAVESATNTSAAETVSPDDVTPPITIVEEPYTEEELQTVTDTTLSFMTAFSTGDYKTSCLLLVDTSWPVIRAVLGGEPLQDCADTAASDVETYELDFSDFALTADQIQVTDAGGGFADVIINGQNMNLKAVKMSNGEIYLDASSGLM